MSGRAGAGRSQRPSEGSGRVLSGRFTVHMMSDVHAISGALDKEQGLRGANSEERQVGLKAGFTPAVPQPCHLPSATQRGRGEGRVPRRGTSVPPAKSPEFVGRNSLYKYRFDQGGADAGVASNRRPSAGSSRHREGAARHRTGDRTGAVDTVGARSGPVDGPQQPGVDGGAGDGDLPRNRSRRIDKEVRTGPVAGRTPGRAAETAGCVGRRGRV